MDEVAVTECREVDRDMRPALEDRTAEVTFREARAVADTMLFDGYSSHARATSVVNRGGGQVGVIAPRAFSELHNSQRWWLETQCLLQPSDDARAGVVVEGRLRFLQPRRRQIEEGADPAFRPIGALAVGERTLVSWDEAEVREVEFRHGIALDEPVTGTGQTERAERTERTERAVVFEAPGEAVSELVRDEDGRVVGRKMNRRFDLRGVLSVGLARVTATHPLCRLRVRIENVTPWQQDRHHGDGDGGQDHDDILQSSLVGVHLLLGISGGTFVSLLDAPPWARPAAEACQHHGLYPVLAGQPQRGDVILAAPISLYDQQRSPPPALG